MRLGLTSLASLCDANPIPQALTKPSSPSGLMNWCLVIGGGAVGLRIGRALATAGREVVVLEENPWTGGETSSRNNEVIHAGFLYEPESLKTRLCPVACDG